MRVIGNLAHRDELWDQCYRDLMARVHLRLGQEVHRLGGDYAHVLDETIGSKHDDRSGEVWLRGRLTYLCSGDRTRPTARLVLGSKVMSTEPAVSSSPSRRSRQESTMLRWLLRREIESFERKWNYDASYLKEIANLSSLAALRFSLATSLGSDRRDVPLAALCAAGITAVRSEDCGPCANWGSRWLSGRACSRGPAGCAAGTMSRRCRTTWHSRGGSPVRRWPTMKRPTTTAPRSSGVGGHAPW